MMDEDRGHCIAEDADYLIGIRSNWKHTDIAELKKVFQPTDDESYRVFLEELFSYVDKQHASLSTSAEQIAEDWLDIENTDDAVDCDVFPEALEDECTEGVDPDRRSMGSDGEEDYNDPDLQLFLKNLKPCGFAYVLDISIGGLKYEDEDELEQFDEPTRKVRKSNPSDRYSQPILKKSRLVKKLKNLDPVVDRISPKYQVTNTKFAQTKSRYCSSTFRKKKNESPTPRRSSRKVARKCLLEYSSSDYSQEEQIRCKRGKKRVRISPDEDYIYSEFLRGYNMDETVYIDDNGNKFYYEKSSDESESSSDSEVVVSATPPSKKRLQSSESNGLTPKTSKKRCLLSGKKGSKHQNAVIDPSYEYRKMLMEELLKPYNKKEHCDLLKEAKDKKPVMHHRDMRGENCSYPDDVRTADSYLDRYDALRMAIEAAQPNEPHKVLHHLRGLLFFLTHVCMEDSFMPWNDKSWMEAVSKSKHH